MKKYKQIKDLPFSKAGDIWEVDGETVRINGSNYTFCSPDLWKNLVLYYSGDDGILNMEGEWFELAGTEDEKKLAREKERMELQNTADYYAEELEKIDERLKELAPHQ
jgi:hypothetical protein